MESIRDREELEAGAAMSAATVKTIRVTEVIGAEVTYDLVGELVQSTGLTRRTIVEMLKGVNHATFHQFKLNPEEFIIKAVASSTIVRLSRSSNTSSMRNVLELLVLASLRKLRCVVHLARMLSKVPSRFTIL